jgi:lysophospholipase L1-like esterase
MRIALLAALAAFAAPLLHAAPPLALERPRHWRIVPIGDSITQGNTNHLTYRYPLWKMLIDAGVDFDFVGSHNQYDIGNPNIPNYPTPDGFPFDFDQEGHVFYQTNQLSGNLPRWLTEGHAGSGGYRPDIALVHAGTNDALLAQPVATFVASMTSIITTLQAHHPEVKVLLATIIPTYSTLDSNQQANATVTALNAQIPGIAAATDRPPGKPDARVIVVDQNTGFLANHTLPAPLGGDTYDGVHPSPAGEEKMARRWLEALQLVIATPTVSRDVDGRLFVDFLRVKGSTRLTFRVGVASIPGAWDWTPAATETVSVISTGAWTERVRQRDLSTDLARFLRLEIVLDDPP